MSKAGEIVRGEAPSFGSNVKALVEGRLGVLPLGSHYSARNNGGQIRIHSTAPGAVAEESLGLFRPELGELARFVVELEFVLNGKGKGRKVS